MSRARAPSNRGQDARDTIDAFAQARQYQESRKANIKKGITANTELNELALSNQAFFFRAGQQELQEFQQQIAQISRTEGISVTYELPGRLTLPSRSDQQLVGIASIRMITVSL